MPPDFNLDGPMKWVGLALVSLFVGTFTGPLGALITAGSLVVGYALYKLFK